MNTNTDPLLGFSPSEIVVGPAGQTLQDAAALERTEDAWWAWHDADQSRIYASTDEAQAVCVAWVAGQSDVGPDLTAALARAAEHISAIEITPGIWAHYAEETRRWYTVTSAQLVELCAYLDDDDAQISSYAYSHWCAGSCATEMPVGWTPGDAYPPAQVVTCQCGSWSGCACEWSGTESDTVVVEYMPEQYRASHTAAGNRGVWPHNGASRVRVSRECAATMIETDREWCSVLALVGDAW